MAKTPERASKLLQDLQSKLKPSGLSAPQELKDLKKNDVHKDDDSGEFFHWSWTPSHLKSLSCHYSHLVPEMLALWDEQNKGEAQPEQQIPDEFVEALAEAGRSTFGPLFHPDQIHRAAFDLTIHELSSDEEVESVDITVLCNKLRKEIGLLDGQEVFDGQYTHGNGYATTTHLVMTDYAAGYCGYLHSKAYAAELFYSEFKDNPQDTEKFQRYRHCVLEVEGAGTASRIWSTS